MEQEIRERAEAAVRGFTKALKRIEGATPGTEGFVRATYEMGEFFHSVVTELTSLLHHEKQRREQAEQELKEYVEASLEASSK